MRRNPYGEALTLDEYKALEAAGEITRPLTWGPMREANPNDVRLGQIASTWAYTPAPKSTPRPEPDDDEENAA